MDSTKDLVLGAVYGYSFEQLRPFIVSLQRTAFNGDLVLLWKQLSSYTRDALRDHGVKLVPLKYRRSGSLNSWSRFWPVLAPVVRTLKGSTIARTILRWISPLQTSRFFAYHDFLAAHEGEYRYALITDVRDVVFQDDPFSGFEGGLMVFEEDANVRLFDETMYNAPWIEELFGRQALTQIGDFPILCSGTIMGTTEALISYLVAFERLLHQAMKIGTGGSDQGVHNYLCRFVMTSSFHVATNENGPILTMATLKKGVNFVVSDNGLILNSTGVPIPVLHQYDRHPELAKRLLQRLRCHYT
jgi:hypothetical protein